MSRAVTCVASVLMGCCFQLKEAGQALGPSSLPPSLVQRGSAPVPLVKPRKTYHLQVLGWEEATDEVG